MKKTTNLVFATLCFCIHIIANGASQEFAVKELAPIVVRSRLKNIVKHEQVKMVITDKTTNKKVLVNMYPEGNAGIYQGHFVVDFLGVGGSLPRLEFNFENSLQKLFIVDRSTTQSQILYLFSNEKDLGVFVKFATEQEEIQKKKASTQAAATAAAAAKAALAAGKSAGSAGASAASANGAGVIGSGVTPNVSAKVLEAREQARLNERNQERERMSLETQEALKREQLLREQEKLNVKEREQRKAEVDRLIQQGNSQYGAGKYKEAVESFRSATELDPSRNEIYYRYGVSLYKVDDYNHSLAVLSQAEGGEQSPVEHSYYVALNHMKLKEYEKAAEEFHSIQEENDKDLSPVAAFFAGNIEYQLKRYPEAKKSFEFVLDNSSDPQMDKEAESMIEEINRIENFLQSMKEYFKYSFNMGLTYDGNVLNMATQNLSTEVAGYRLSYGASAAYKWWQTYKSELSTQISFSDMYSVTSGFKSDATLQSADPQMLNMGIPFRYQFEAFGKGFVWNLNPSFTSLTMSAESSTRKQILQSTSLATDLSYQLNSNWMSLYKLDFTQDLSFLSSSSTTSTDGSSTENPDDQAANRYTLSTTQTRLLDPKATRLLPLDLSYVLNQAKGKNNNYTKLIAGVSYVFPFFGGTQAVGKIEYTDLVYPNNSNDRHDKTTTLTFSGSKSLSKKWNWSATGQYVSNSTNLDANKYDKFVISTNIVYSGALERK